MQGILLAALGWAGALHTGLVSPPRTIQPASSLLTQPAAASLARRSSPTLRRSASPVLFVDQADNLAGPLFGVSLFPYLAFLYFIRQPVNGLSDTAKSGFTFLLVFVFSTIITAIVSTKTFGLTLADVDWLHGDAEQLLTLTNVINVVGLKTTLDAYAAAPPGEAPKAPEAALPVTKICVGAAAAAIVGTFIASAGNVAEHTAYLGGLGNLPDGLWTYGFTEPANALSLPTWVIHVSSLLEWLVAMGCRPPRPTHPARLSAVCGRRRAHQLTQARAHCRLVWRIGIASGNPRWKGLTWAMIPSHSSGVCACVYHIFYNSPDLGFVVLLQAHLAPTPRPEPHCESM